MPDIALGSERSRSISSLSDISTYTLREDVVFKESDPLGAETSTDEEEETSRDNQEPVECGRRSCLVDKISDNTSGDETNDDRNGNSSGGQTE